MISVVQFAVFVLGASRARGVMAKMESTALRTLTAGAHQLHCVDRIEGRRWVGPEWRALTAVDRGDVVVAPRVPSRNAP